MKIEELWDLVRKYKPEDMGNNTYIKRHGGDVAISFFIMLIYSNYEV